MFLKKNMFFKEVVNYQGLVSFFPCCVGILPWIFPRNIQQDPLNGPLKPEYLIARSQLTERGPLGFGPIQFFDGIFISFNKQPPPAA